MREREYVLTRYLKRYTESLGSETSALVEEYGGYQIRKTVQWKYFVTTMFVSAVVGVMSGIIANNNWRISFLSGYAGIDFLESLYK